MDHTDLFAGYEEKKPMKKKKYTILIPEVHYSFREVEAENEQEAIEKAWDAEETFLEYSHTLDNQFIKIEVKELKE
jgi:hypothetical protein